MAPRTAEEELPCVKISGGWEELLTEARGGSREETPVLGQGGRGEVCAPEARGSDIAEPSRAEARGAGWEEPPCLGQGRQL